MPVAGDGDRSILIVGEAPGANEDEAGKPFIGLAGKKIQEALRLYGIRMFDDCWVTNCLSCRPPKNRDPKASEIRYCQPLISNAVRKYKPQIIIPLGRFGVLSVIGLVWPNVGSASRWFGYQIPCQEWNTWICPTYHPSYILRSENKPEVSLIWRRHLKRAIELKERPWDKGKPDFISKVRRVYSADEAAGYIQKMIQSGAEVAFDYETNMLKPESDEAKIHSCAVCWKGKRTIAFPWRGAAVTAMSELLRSDCPKIAANLKFEERWTRKILGHGVRRWAWDTMQAAHIIDNRSGVTSLDFQSFAVFGEPCYSEVVSPYLKGEPNKPNRIGEVDLGELLLYNGMDALLEYKLADVQRGSFKS
jgi:uracil-DNA glycosylase family 4